MNFESTLVAPICERLGIKYPIVQVGMAFAAYGERVDAIFALWSVTTLDSAIGAAR